MLPLVSPMKQAVQVGGQMVQTIQIGQPNLYGQPNQLGQMNQRGQIGQQGYIFWPFHKNKNKKNREEF